MKVLLQNRDPNSWMGGDSLKIDKIIEGLKKLGVDIKFDHHVNTLEVKGMDIIHLFHLSMTWTQGQWKNAKSNGVNKLILNSIYHPVEHDTFKYRDQKEICEEASAIICMSEAEKELIKERTGFADDSKFHIIPNGIDKMFYDVVDNKNRGFVLGAGRLASSKGFHLLAQACKELKLPLLIVGPEFEKGYVDRIKKIYPGMNYLSKVPRSIMPAMYSSARVFASLSDWEVYSYTILEAGASGANIVYTNRGLGGKDLPYIEVADVSDMEDIKAKIQKQWDKGYSQDLSNWLNNNGFHWEDYVKKIKKIYEKIL